ncbi:MAG: hypothetical protein ACXAC2_20415, partial [Candidatus Kariarchaeaceae archaeon]
FLLIWFLFINHSIQGSLNDFDLTKIGISEGDEFTYSVGVFDVEGEREDETVYPSNSYLYNGHDFSGVSEHTMKVFLIKEPSPDPNAYCLRVYFNVTLGENNMVTTLSCLDIFGQIVIFTEWDVWGERIESEVELLNHKPEIDITFRNEEYFEYEKATDLEFDEGSFQRSTWGYSSGEFFVKYKYNKDTGMAIYFEQKIWAYFPNGSRQGYHISLFEGTNEAEPAFVRVSNISFLGILVMPLYRILKRKT